LLELTVPNSCNNYITVAKDSTNLLPILSTTI
jgi:hypothetical protein